MCSCDLYRNLRYKIESTLTTLADKIYRMCSECRLITIIIFVPDQHGVRFLHAWTPMHLKPACRIFLSVRIFHTWYHNYLDESIFSVLSFRAYLESFLV